MMKIGQHIGMSTETTIRLVTFGKHAKFIVVSRGFAYIYNKSNWKGNKFVGLRAKHKTTIHS